MSVQALTAVEATDLHEMEVVIEKGLATFVEVGRALQRIRDGRLYRETHSTFEEYIRDKWGLSRSHAYRQIEAAVVATTLSPIGDIPAPATESVARELAPLKDEPEQLSGAWRETVEQHGPKPSATQAREVVKRRRKAAPARKPSRAQQGVRASVYAGQIHALGRPSNGAVDLILDTLAGSPNWSWDTFLEEIDTAQKALARLTEKVEERAGRGAEA
jgi:hypothetical protein